jgi:hypothetical protein
VERLTGGGSFETSFEGGMSRLYDLLLKRKVSSDELVDVVLFLNLEVMHDVSFQLSLTTELFIV